MTYRMTWKGAMVGAYSRLMFGVAEFQADTDAEALDVMETWRVLRHRPKDAQFLERIEARERADVIFGKSFLTPPQVVRNLTEID